MEKALGHKAFSLLKDITRVQAGLSQTPSVQASMVLRCQIELRWGFMQDEKGFVMNRRACAGTNIRLWAVFAQHQKQEIGSNIGPTKGIDLRGSLLFGEKEKLACESWRLYF
jgi:hypothetical protein